MGGLFRRETLRLVGSGKGRKSRDPETVLRSQFYDLFLDPQVGASEPFFVSDI
jgi:hypothetical protein